MIGQHIFVNTEPGTREKVRAALELMEFPNVRFFTGPSGAYDIAITINEEFPGTGSQIQSRIEDIKEVTRVIFVPCA